MPIGRFLSGPILAANGKIIVFFGDANRRFPSGRQVAVASLYRQRDCVEAANLETGSRYEELRVSGNVKERDRSIQISAITRHLS